VITLAEPLDLDVLRIRHEFLTVPDLRLSPDAVALLLNVSHHHAAAMLDALASEQFLVRHADGCYSRPL
jgi:hypothetical protein